MNAEDLFVKYQAGKCSPEEQAVVENWLTFGGVTKLDLSEAELEQDLSELRQRIAGIPVKRRTLWPRIAGIAVAAVAIIVFGVWFFGAGLQRQNGAGNKTGLDELAANDIAPGRNGATITMGNGKVIELSDQKTGVVVGNGLKYSDGSAIGSSSLTSVDQKGTGGKAQDLTASTGRGQTYQFTLADGTKVWLNADSKISFPVKFSGRERKILLDGEGYFEVAKDKAHPFIVETVATNGQHGQQVEVLGTHFNINSYDDEDSAKTALLEGSVKVSALNGSGRISNEVILKPNEEAMTTAGGIKVNHVNTEAAVAWKDDLFRFDNTDLPVIMRQIGRWYDLDVIYQGSAGSRTFSGLIRRDVKLSQILRILETGGIKFRIEEPLKAGGAKRIVVMQ